jgi:hypothetical protein
MPAPGTNAQQQTTNTSSQSPPGPSVQTQESNRKRASTEGKGNVKRLLYQSNQSTSTSNTTGSSDGASTSKSTGKKAERYAIDAQGNFQAEAVLDPRTVMRKGQLQTLMEPLARTKGKPFSEVGPHFERLIDALAERQHPDSRHENDCIRQVPTMLMQCFDTWNQETAAPLFKKAFEMMDSRAQVFRQRNETLEEEYLSLKLRENQKSFEITLRIAEKRDQLNPNDTEALEIYGKAPNVLARYSRHWREDPRTLPLFETALEMAYQQCYLLNRHGHEKNIEPWERAAKCARRVFDVLEKALSSEHKEISDLAFTQLTSFKNLLVENLQKLNTVDLTINERCAKLIADYKAKHGHDHIPSTAMEELD